ncbi:DNA-binding protein [Panacagrimonas perspica]|uniref:DNA-binding protein n=1 Tax=Panacagrimonas perspica TaxID=381431 RepID=UPI0013C2FC66|nr:DNA-binding protein [Panacagrimonas perspica]
MTIKDVADAVAALEAAGISVSASSVRERLGRGSFSTIAPLLRAVRDQQQPGGKASAPLAIERDVPAAVIEQIAAAARKAGEEAYKALAASLEVKIAEVTANVGQERQIMRSDMDQVLADARDARERAQAVEGELREARERLTAVDSERLRAQEQLHGEQIRRATETESLARELAAAQMELKAARARIEALSAEAGELRGRLGASERSAR